MYNHCFYEVLPLLVVFQFFFFFKLESQKNFLQFYFRHFLRLFLPEFLLKLLLLLPQLVPGLLFNLNTKFWLVQHPNKNVHPLLPLPPPCYPGPDLSLQEHHRPPLLLLEPSHMEPSASRLQSHHHPPHLAELAGLDPGPDEGLQSVVPSLDDQVGLLGLVTPPALLDNDRSLPLLEELSSVVPTSINNLVDF